MKRLFLLVLFALVVLTPVAHAANDDRMMGFYEGAFTGDAGGATGVYARVAGLSETRWKLVLYVAAASGEELRMEAEGSAEAPRKPASFEAAVDWDGPAKLTATLSRRTLEGSITPKGKPAVSFALKRADKASPTLGAAPPEGAIALFDGANLDQWRRDPEGWCIQPDGSMQVCSSNLRTKEELGGGLYHIEFMTPYMPEAREQARGNSGVYLMGRYEVQVLDSFGWQPAWDFCGGIYKVAVPLADATYPPLTWQTYDITLTPAQFDAAGAKTANARITVVHNGITVHDTLELPRPTPGGVSGDDALAGPLLLQDHNDDVKFRNIWFKPAE